MQSYSLYGRERIENVNKKMDKIISYCYLYGNESTYGNCTPTSTAIRNRDIC